MKSERILNVMGNVDDALIEAAQPPVRTKKRNGLRWTAAAACLAAVLIGGFTLYSRTTVPNTSDLPMLDITPKEEAAAFGFEGYMAYDISELSSANPWTEDDKLKTLPVYQNPVEYDRAGAPSAPVSAETMESMKTRLLEAAERLGLENVQVTDNAPSQEEIDAVTEKFASVGEKVPEGYFEPTEAVAEQDGIKLTVGADLAVRIEFDPAIDLPGEVHFSYNGTYEETRAAAEYLLERYRDLLGMEKPQVSITGGDYTYDGEQMFGVEFFDAAGDKTQQIVNYNFNTARFACNDEGKLWIIRLNQPDLSQKVGDYPIISVKEAQALLCSGNYITTVPEEMPGEEYIAKVELIYRDSDLDEYFMPYYRFYVEVPDMARNNGLKTFGAYYVPAVSGEFLTGMPVWEGQFN